MQVLETENIYGCVKQIWRKFTEKEKVVYNSFIAQTGDWKMQYRWKHTDMQELAEEQFDVVIHNMACYAAWSVRDIL